MPDTAQTPEAVALELLRMVAAADKLSLSTTRNVGAEEHATKQYILDTYAECLLAAQGRRKPE